MVALAQPQPSRRPRSRPWRRMWRPKSDLPRSTTARSGYRFYSPKLGRWVNRDPIGEDSDRSVPSSAVLPMWAHWAGLEGGSVDEANLYLFVRNSPMGNFDAYGLEVANCPCDECDRWSVVCDGSLSFGGVPVVAGVHCYLMADLTSCRMSEIGRHYDYVGVGVSLPAKIPGSLVRGVDTKSFTTSCISWDDHVGFGRYASAALIIGPFGWGWSVYDMPQQYWTASGPPTFASFSVGLTWTWGYWYFPTL
jgi:hypothetical protein